MRMRLSRRLSLSMALLALVSILLLSGLLYFSTRSLFSQYISGTQSLQSRNWVEFLQDYYRQNGSLEGVQDLLSRGVPSGNVASSRSLRGHHGTANGQHGHMLGNGRQVVVVDSSGQVVGDSSGTRLGMTLPPTEQRNALPIIVNGQTVGGVLFPGLESTRLGNLEVNFLKNLAGWSLLAGLLTLLLALGAGIFISKKITRPLSQLSEAADCLARGDVTSRAPVAGDEEIAHLAEAFNFMAEKLEETRIIRDNLTADIIHELKTPLAILRGNLESLQSGILPPSEETFISLQDEAIRLTKLVDDLAVLNRAESGRLPLQPVSCALEEILEGLAPLLLQVDLEEKDFHLQKAADLPRLWVDRERTLQVLINVLGNALAFTPPGGQIVLQAFPEGKEVHLQIADSGPGIPGEDLPHVFDRFYRADKSRSRRLGGTGLGLAIARSFVQAQGGQIWAESTPGQGSVFHILLPAAGAGDAMDTDNADFLD